MTQLHEKQWALLEAALADYDQIIQDPRYKIDMGTWYGRDADKDICYVCLAGCFLANTLKWEYGTPFRFDYLPIATQEALARLDILRIGRYQDQHDTQYWPEVFSEKYAEIGGFGRLLYATNPTLWRSAMAEFVKFLKEKDL